MQQYSPPAGLCHTVATTIYCHAWHHIYNGDTVATSYRVGFETWYVLFLVYIYTGVGRWLGSPPSLLKHLEIFGSTCSSLILMRIGYLPTCTHYMEIKMCNSVLIFHAPRCNILYSPWVQVKCFARVCMHVRIQKHFGVIIILILHDFLYVWHPCMHAWMHVVYKHAIVVLFWLL